MNTAVYQNTWRSGRCVDRHRWIDALSSRGMHCSFDANRAGKCVFAEWHDAGQVGIGKVELAWQCLSPVMHEGPSWNGNHLFLKVVQRGYLSMEQNGQTHHFEDGSVILVDPLCAFKEYFCEPTRIAVLRIPKKALQDRGLRHNFHDLWAPNLESPDVRAVREFLLYTSGQAGETSERLLARLGDQCLDLLDVLINDPATSARGRTGAATVLRAKQVIARLVGDPCLSVAQIASELNVSAGYLTRTLRANGLSPMRYAWSLRLEYAARLLASTPEGAVQAKEVAYRCGFASAAHFSRAFKNRYGMSPRAFATHRRKTGVATENGLSIADASDPSTAAIASAGPTCNRQPRSSNAFIDIR